MDIQVFKWMRSDNDWIGFWGGYLGGLCTLSGVILTIQRSKKEASDNQRISIMPYLAIVKDRIVEKNIPIIKISLHNIPLGVEEKGSNRFYFKELIIEGTLRSVGMGHATNCRIEEIIVEYKKTIYPTGTESIVLQERETPFFITLHEFGLHDEDISERFNHEYESYFSRKAFIPKEPELQITFELRFEDVIGNKYEQHVVYGLPILEKNKFGFMEEIADFKTIGCPKCYKNIY
ncbi:MAG: hypothetical protein VB034_07470 [Eubacteriales bacterium]|nr:hypothetical protein [Eubacteriales bacterium]